METKRMWANYEKGRLHLPPKALWLCKLGNSIAVKIYVQVGHLADFIPHSCFCTVRLPEKDGGIKFKAWMPQYLGSWESFGTPHTVLFHFVSSQDLVKVSWMKSNTDKNLRKSTNIEVLPKFHEEWSIFLPRVKEVVHEEVCIVNKVSSRHLKVF